MAHLESSPSWPPQPPQPPQPWRSCATAAMPPRAPGPEGLLIGDAVRYDTHSRLLLGPFFARLAADMAAVAPNSARVPEVGCGPGHLSTRLAHHRFDVTGPDPAMIARAQATTDHPGNRDGRRPSLLVGDVRSPAFPDQSFDLAASTLSMHHWTDPTASLTQIGRVPRPGARTLIWDFRPSVRPHLFGPHHAHLPDPADPAGSSPLQAMTTTP